MLTSFEELMLDAGVKFDTEVLVQTVMTPIDDLDVKLGISEDTHIIYIKRLRTVDKEPVLIQETYIPHQICPSLLEEDVAGESLIRLFDKKYGITITRVQDFIEIAYLNDEERKILGSLECSAALLLSQYFSIQGIRLLCIPVQSSIPRDSGFLLNMSERLDKKEDFVCQRASL